MIITFGGSSSSAEQFRKVKKIVEADEARRFVVVSAAGKRDRPISKITDLLYLVSAHLQYHVSCDDAGTIGRFCEIAKELDLQYPIGHEFGVFANAPSAAISRLSTSSAAAVLHRAHDGRIPWVSVRGCRRPWSRSTRTERLIWMAQASSCVPPSAGEALRAPRILQRHATAKFACSTRRRRHHGRHSCPVDRRRSYENWTDVSGFLTRPPHR
ncbi:MAG: hypothetical protein ACLT98_03980 [Eggerthellaceae bacterium]